MLERPVNVLRYASKGQQYEFRYFDHQSESVRQRIARMAASPEYEMSWYDAAMLSRRIREHDEHVQANETIEPFTHDPTLPK